MPLKRVTRLRKLCDLLAGHSWEQGERIAQAATDMVLDWLPEDQAMVDMLSFQLCLGEKLGHFRGRLTGIDDEHMSELQVDRNLREQRDRSTADLRQRSLQLRDSLDGLFGTGGSFKIFQEPPIIPPDPVALHQLMGRVINNLGDEDFPMPEPLQQGFKLDRQAAVRDLEEPHQRLGAALKKLAAAASASKHSQSVKDEEIEEVAVFTGRVMRYYEALYDLVGFDRLSDRLRQSSHRVASGDIEDGEPAAGEPVAGAPAAGDPDENAPSDESGTGDAPDVETA